MTENNSAYRLMQGNEAVTEGALAAGVRFYAGYPITPSTEIAEIMAERLPQLRGKFIQMEDEIASMAAIIGASLTGVKSMTATSGPGFSLKQENLGYAIIAEVPCVLVNVQRLGPSTGIATAPAQGDVMQARWGTHGDHPIIVLTPASVEECFHLAVRAVNLSEKFRIPVILLLDEVIGHMREKVLIPAQDEVININRLTPKEEIYDHGVLVEQQEVRPLPAFGDGYRIHVTGLVHDYSGFPTSQPEVVASELIRLNDKVENNLDEIISFEAEGCEDADLIVIAYGCVARSAATAVEKARALGLKVGLFRPITIWPFPEEQIQKLAWGKGFLVPEMNFGQLIQEVERVVAGRERVFGLNKVNGEIISPDEILNKIHEVMPNVTRD